MTDKKKIAFHTLGCKLNFTETSAIARTFPSEQYARVSANSKADLSVINTCTVTDAADRKCRQAITKFINLSPDAFIAVTGCYAQLRPQEISSIPGVDLILGMNERFDIADYLQTTYKKIKTEIHSCSVIENNHFNPSYSAGDRTRSFLKVQDGCDYACSYCTIPMARGTSRNPEIHKLVREAEVISETGIKEIVLTGVNVGDFGKSTGDNLESLLKELVKVKGIERYRISSIEPNLLTDQILLFAAQNPAILPHFHIPLQSGSDKILKLMRRRYKRSLFESRVEKIKNIFPMSGIGADVITGFPGESDEDFDDTYCFLSKLPISYLHVFTYSERPDTFAINMPDKIPHSEKERRSRLLSRLSEMKQADFQKLNSGEKSEVLFERTKSDGLITGFSSNYIRTEYPWDVNLAGTIRKVMLNKTEPTGRMSVKLTD